MKITRRQLRRMILNEVSRLNEVEPKARPKPKITSTNITFSGPRAFSMAIQSFYQGSSEKAAVYQGKINKEAYANLKAARSEFASQDKYSYVKDLTDNVLKRIIAHENDMARAEEKKFGLTYKEAKRKATEIKTKLAS